LIIVSFLCFLLINTMSSDPAEVVLRTRQTPVITEIAIAEVREELGLDQPFLMRYGQWLKKSMVFDFGVSYVNNSRTVAQELKRTLPGTLQLAISSVILVMVVSIPIGVMCAYYKNRLVDKIVRTLLFGMVAMPSYWFALLCIWFFSVKLDLLPTGGRGGWQSYILPVLSVSIGYISIYVRLIRSNVIEVLEEDFVFFGRARGLSEGYILRRHVLKNSLQSCITALGMSIPQLIAGTLVVENIFSWPGIGRLSIEAILNRDYPIIQAYIWLIGLLFILFNLFFDLLHAVIDPRIRKSEVTL